MIRVSANKEVVGKVRKLSMTLNLSKLANMKVVI